MVVPAGLLATAAPSGDGDVLSESVQAAVGRSDPAENKITLGAAAEPPAGWWRAQGSGAVLHVDGEITVSEISYLMVDDIDHIRELLQALSATIVTQDTGPTDVGNRSKRAAPAAGGRGTSLHGWSESATRTGS